MFSFINRRLTTILFSAVVLMLLPFAASVPAAKAEPHIPDLMTRQAVSITSNCNGAFACAIAYSPAQSKPYFGSSPAEANGYYGGQDDSTVVAEANALTRCSQSGATDCDVVISVENGYVSIVIDTASPHPYYWGSAYAATPQEARTKAIQYCHSAGGTMQGCSHGTIDTEGRTGPNETSKGWWGYFNSNKTVEAIVSAYGELGTAGNCPGYSNCVDHCLVWVQDRFGWTTGGNWAPNPSKDAADAWDAFEYLQTKQGSRLATVHLKPAMPGVNDIGSLVWFARSSHNGDGGHVGIYLGNNQYISPTDSGIQISDIGWWSKNSATYEGWSFAPSNWYSS